MKQDVKELIRRRRAQMMVHSYLYYWRSDPLIDDHTFDKWAAELADLQKKHPGPVGFYDAEFEDWNGDTGMHLPKDEWVKRKADALGREQHYRAVKEGI